MSLLDENDPQLIPASELVGNRPDSRHVLFRIPEPSLPTTLRPRVRELLDAAATRPVVLVRGWAGTGKTVAVADWARAVAANSPVVWVSLTSTDSLPGRLWTSIGEAAAAVIGAPTPAVTAAPAGDLERAFQLLTTLARRSATLVLDDVHHLEDVAAVDILDQMLRHPPPGLRLVLVGRHEPRIHLQRLRVDGLLGEVPSLDLAFNAQECMGALLNWGAAIPAEAAEGLVGAVQGWPAGIRLAALAIAPAQDQAAAAAGFGLTHPSVGEFIAEEVEHLPAPRREVLLAACIVDEICAPLAAVLAEDEDAGEQLAHLAADGYLTAGEPGWYRTREYTRSMVREHYLDDDPAQLAELHRRAAVWFAGSGHRSVALEHAVHSRDWALVAPLVLESVASTTLAGTGTDLRPLLQRIPERAVVEHPELMLAGAWSQFRVGATATAEQALGLARRALGELPEQHLGSARFFAHLLEAAIAYQHDDATALLAASRRADELGAGLPTSVGPEWLELTGIAPRLRAIGELWYANPTDVLELAEWPGGGTTAVGLALSGLVWEGHVALAQASVGEVARARATSEAALGPSALPDGQDPEAGDAAAAIGAGPAWLALALAAGGQGDARTAQRAVRLGMAANADWSGLVSVGLQLASTQLLISQDHLHGAREVLARIGGQLGSHRAPMLVWLHTLLTIEVELAAGSTGRAAELLAEHDRVWTPPEPTSHPDLDCLVIQRARLLVADRRTSEAASLLDPLLALDGTWAAAAWLVMAQTVDALQQDAAATQALSRSLDLATTEGFRLPFLRPSPRLRSMLRRHLDVVGTHAEFVSQVLADDAEPVPHVPAPLTQRELSVLAYLPTLSSNEEIANALSISINTVKQHLKSIHRKLQVGTRREAVRVARRLDLLPRTGRP